MDWLRVNEYIAKLERSMLEPARAPLEREKLAVGLDLGTAITVLAVVGEDGAPLACEWERSDEALKDGVVVDYIKACDCVKRLKSRLERRLGARLESCAIAMPPGTQESDGRTHAYVASSAGLEAELTADEPNAANLVLGLKNGAVVDIGGGTTGISIIENGKVVKVADEATGGHHLTLVISGALHLPYERAEEFKLDPKNSAEVLALTTPVIEKMAQIVKNELAPHRVSELCLVGGTCCLPGMERVFERYTGLACSKPANPLLVTPLGIALAHLDHIRRED